MKHTRPITHYRRYALSFAVIAAISLSAHLMQPQESTPLVAQLRDALHGPGFAILTALSLFLLRGSSPSRIHYGLCIAFMCCLAVASEGAQFFSARDADLRDLRADILGIFGGAGLVSAIDDHLDLGWRLRLVIGSIALSGLVFIMSPPVKIVSAIASQQRAFPVLASFDAKWEEYFYGRDTLVRERQPPPPGWPAAGAGSVGTVRLGTNNLPALELSTLPDWQGYDALEFWAASSSGSPIDVTIRVHDAFHNGAYNDRYNQTLSFSSAPQKFSIPLGNIAIAPQGRQLELSRVEKIIFFTTVADKNRELFLDDIRLVKRASSLSAND